MDIEGAELDRYPRHARVRPIFVIAAYHRVSETLDYTSPHQIDESAV
jgi:hypothetical protein